MKLSTCSARAVTREGTVKNAAIKIIKQKAQANYSRSIRAQQQRENSGEAETCWDATNENVNNSAETTQQHLGSSDSTQVFDLLVA
ncbi:unnamed protein product [Tetraodon nigroviridis]|uniref:(spotted green pufferfish) hypothetical protein n=1 Tax=Tetraodon nigroviridis TaxID=99883 RepID=Q4SPZ7_TETNG|nr:unnamed protein product [Tetraodon nigroviridis]